ncbi:MAG: hypothetical protein ACUVQP_08270 [Bacteroidales bacterium]
MNKAKFILIIFIVLYNTIVYAQLLSDRYVNAKFGQGVLYGGRGINVEYRYKHFGFGASGGYQGEQYIYEHTIKSSYNVGFNSRYYYYHKNGSWQVYGGLYFGWLSNYYLPLIGETKYKPIVYGTSPILGIEIREDILNIDLGLTVDPGILILHKQQHQHYIEKFNISTNFVI